MDVVVRFFGAISCEVLRDDVAGEAATGAPALTVGQAGVDLQDLPFGELMWQWQISILIAMLVYRSVS